MSLLGWSGAEETVDDKTWWFNSHEGGSRQVVAGSGFNGSPGYEIAGTNPAWVKSFFGTTSDTVIVGFHWYLSNSHGAGAATIRFHEQGTDPQCRLTVTRGGHILIDRDSTFIGMSAEPINQQKGAYIECKIKIAESPDGTVEVRLNGNPTPVLNLTGIDTRNHAPEPFHNVWDSVEIGGSTINVLRRFDDIYVCDGAGPAPFNDFLGPIHCQVKMADGNGNVNQWTGSDADSVDNYLHVDELAEDGDSTFVESSVDDEIDLYDCSLSIPSHNMILALEVFQAARKTDAGRRAMRAVLRAGGTNFFGAEKYINPSFQAYRELHLTNPDTAAAFLTTDVIEVGQQVRAG